MNIPFEIGQAKVISFNIVSGYINTGKTKHIIDNILQDDFYGLAICKYLNDGGYYLFYCTSEWKAIADTWHEAVEDAKDQAEYEYFGIEDNWIDI